MFPTYPADHSILDTSESLLCHPEIAIRAKIQDAEIRESVRIGIQVDGGCRPFWVPEQHLLKVLMF